MTRGDREDFFFDVREMAAAFLGGR